MVAHNKCAQRRVETRDIISHVIINHDAKIDIMPVNYVKSNSTLDHHVIDISLFQPNVMILKVKVNEQSPHAQQNSKVHHTNYTGCMLKNAETLTK
ncbi:CLUMA_CG003568, isoform A [Clunio marinus]|uniref:CLUMA_CG003568, isoform A n=1 Tax=Clunio marinus TaxID=568069 RepID=A0A1J1HPD2_9DIPT|nr:CLUMA_CG003568, isoform A [Clunio marinus]